MNATTIAVPQPRIIVIGTSAGGLQTLSTLIRQLPEEIPAAVFIVVHMAAASSADVIREMLQKHTRNRLKVAEHLEPVIPGTFYLAPANHHLLLSGNNMLVTQGPRENQFRPSIDPLFRSAAASYASSVIGIILTGVLQDGTVGMDAVKRSGGITIVQHPEDALFPDMPLSVLKNLDVDHNVPIASMGALLLDLLKQPIPAQTEVPEDIKLEARIAERVMGTTEEVEQLGRKVAYTCPECGGNLWEMKHGSVQRYRCHLGHAYTADILIKEMNEEVEETLWVALRMMEERKNLLTSMIDRDEKTDPPAWIKGQRERIEDMKVHINRIREVLLGRQQIAEREKDEADKSDVTDKT